MKKSLIIFASLILSFNLFAQQDNSEELFRKGLEHWEKSDYVSAKKIMRQVVGMASAVPGLREEAQEIIDRCNDKLIDAQMSRVATVLDVSESSIQFASTGDFKEVTIISNEKWSVVSKPEWCDVVEKTSKYMKIRCDENPISRIRPGQIVVRAGNLTREIFVHQDAGEELRGRVFFRVSPNNAYVEASDGSSGYSSSPLVFNKGRYNIRILKEGYLPVDTTIFIRAVEDSVRNYDFRLRPIFGKLHPVFKDEEGNILTDVDFQVGKVSVDLDDLVNSHSYDDRETIRYYGLYKDGMIPLNSGVYDVRASVPGYETVTEKVIINKGEVVEFERTLKSIMGSFVVNAGRCAEGAKVTVPDLGVVAEVGDTLQLPVGTYQVEVQKKGYLLDVGVLDVSVSKGDVTEVTANMTRMVDLLVSTDQGGESVYVNGVRVKYQEPYYKIALTEGEDYDVDIRKRGFWHVHRQFKVTSRDSLFDLRNLSLQSVDTISIKANEPDLTIELRRKDGSSADDFGEGHRTPVIKGDYTELAVPYGKYKLRLYRTNESRRSRRLAYSGDLNFSPEKKDFHVQTWMTTSLASLRFIGATWYFLDARLSEREASHLPSVASLNIGEVAIVKGLSTTLAKGTLFNSKAMEFPHGISDWAGKTSNVLTAVSCMFLNYDFRVGGHSFRHGDANVLLSYTYYPDMSMFADSGWTHFGGHDLFIGVEACSRLKVLNASLRMGLQYVNGKRNYNVSEYDAESGYWVSDRYVSYPLQRLAFVVGLNVNIGAGGAKGYNIWRVF